MRFLLAEISIRIYITEFNEVLTYGQRKKYSRQVKTQICSLFGCSRSKDS